MYSNHVREDCYTVTLHLMQVMYNAEVSYHRLYGYLTFFIAIYFTSSCFDATAPSKFITKPRIRIAITF